MAYSNILWKAQALQTEFVHLQVSKLKKTPNNNNNKNCKQQQTNRIFFKKSLDIEIWFKVVWGADKVTHQQKKEQQM